MDFMTTGIWVAPYIIYASKPYHTYMNTIRKMNTGNGNILRKCYVMYFKIMILFKAEK